MRSLSIDYAADRPASHAWTPGLSIERPVFAVAGSERARPFDNRTQRHHQADLARNDRCREL
jgi:hypothetical protein